MILDILCFSHLRWNFVYQRPQHLIGRFGKIQRVLFIEEPEYGEYEDHYVASKQDDTNVIVITPKLFHERTSVAHALRMKDLLDLAMEHHQVKNYLCWYYTPMALQFAMHLVPKLVIYDCMDELSAFMNAPEKLVELENELFRIADVIFTGGLSLFEHKKDKHHYIFPFPSSIDKEHFLSSRTIRQDPMDQKDIPFPRFGFYGVIDERFDIELLDKIASEKPDWQFVLIGPIAKIDPSVLPAYSNIHHLGQREYKDLPAYLSGWDVAMMPFAVNESTRFISPTKTPEYLAGGKPVIATPVPDVVNPYGEHALVHIADSAESFIREGERILTGAVDRDTWIKRVDLYLSTISWDKTWSNMNQIIGKALMKKNLFNPEKNEAYV